LTAATVRHVAPRGPRKAGARRRNARDVFRYVSCMPTMVSLARSSAPIWSRSAGTTPRPGSCRAARECTCWPPSCRTGG
jgi:hypothetical protein